MSADVMAAALEAAAAELAAKLPASLDMLAAELHDGMRAVPMLPISGSQAMAMLNSIGRLQGALTAYSHAVAEAAGQRPAERRPRNAKEDNRGH